MKADTPEEIYDRITAEVYGKHRELVRGLELAALGLGAIDANASTATPDLGEGENYEHVLTADKLLFTLYMLGEE